MRFQAETQSWSSHTGSSETPRSSRGHRNSHQWPLGTGQRARWKDRGDHNAFQASPPGTAEVRASPNSCCHPDRSDATTPCSLRPSDS